MKLIELLRETPLFLIEKNMVSLYPRMKDSLPAYAEMYEELLLTSPKETDNIIQLQDVEEFGDTWTHINGASGELYTADNCEDVGGESMIGEPMIFSLSFMAWDEWLGSKISENALKDYDELDILTHCLWEMSFHGFTAKSVSDASDELDVIVKEAREDFERRKNGEETKGKFITLDEMMKDLDIDLDEED